MDKPLSYQDSPEISDSSNQIDSKSPLNTSEPNEGDAFNTNPADERHVLVSNIQNTQQNLGNSSTESPTPSEIIFKKKTKQKIRLKSKETDKKFESGLSKYSGVSLVDAGEIQVLIVGIGKVRQKKWENWINAISHNWRIKSSDFLPYIQGDVPNYYSGKNSLESEIRLHYSLSNKDENEDLHTFQTERQVLGVLGIVDCSLSLDLTKSYSDFHEILTNNTTAVGFKCFGFDFPLDVKPQIINGINVISKFDKNLSGFIKSQINEFSGILVSALSLMADSIEIQTSKNHSHNNDDSSTSHSIYGTGLAGKSARVVNEMTKNIDNNSQYIDSHNTYNSNQNTSTTYNDDNPIGFGDIRPRRNLSSDSISSYKERSFSVSDANQGRIKKLEGDLLLMAGRITEAIAAYRTSIDLSLLIGDYTWQGCALEGYASSLFILAERKHERSFLVALALCPPETSVSSTINKDYVYGFNNIPIAAINSDEHLKNKNTYDPSLEYMGENGIFSLIREIALRFTEAITLYEKSNNFSPLLHSEACLRRAILQLLLDKTGTGSQLELNICKILNRDPLGKIIENIPSNSFKSGLSPKSKLDGSEMAAWVQRGWTQAIMSLQLKDLMNLSATISMVFNSAKYRRKQAFFLRQFLLLVQPLLVKSVDSSRLASQPNSQFKIDIDTQKQIVECLGLVSSLYHVENSSVSMNNSVVIQQWAFWLSSKPEIKSIIKSERTGMMGSGWYHLKSDVLRECVSIAESIPSYPHTISGSFRLLSCLNSLESRLANLVKLGEGDNSAAQEIERIHNERDNLTQYLRRVVNIYHQKFHFDPNDPRKQRQLIATKNLPALMAGLGKNVKNSFVASKLVPRVIGRDSTVVGDVFNNLLQSIHPSNKIGTPDFIVYKSDNSKGHDLTPFLYDPNKKSSFSKSSSSSNVVLVAGENSQFLVTFYNPFFSPLHLSNVQLLVSAFDPAPEFEKPNESADVDEIYSNSANEPLFQGILQGYKSESIAKSPLTTLVLPPNSLHTVPLNLIPLKSGPAQIIGVQCSIFEHISICCLLPELSSDDLNKRTRFQQVRKRLAIDLPESRLNSPFSSSLTMALTKPDSGFVVPIEILPKQPKLEINIEGLENGPSSSFASLNEGEIVPFSVILQNNDSSPVDFTILFDFTVDDSDSSSREYLKPAKSSNNEYINSKKSKALKLSNSLIKSTFKPAFDHETPSRIDGGKYLKLDYNIFGFPGCNGSILKILYGAAPSSCSSIKENKISNNPQNESFDSESNGDESMYLREIKYKIDIKVNKLIFPSFNSPCKIIPIPDRTRSEISNSDKNLFISYSHHKIIQELAMSIENFHTPGSSKLLVDINQRNSDSVLKMTKHQLMKYISKYFCLVSFDVCNLNSFYTEVCFDINLRLPGYNFETVINNKKAENLIVKMYISIPGNCDYFRVFIPISRQKILENQVRYPVPGLDIEATDSTYSVYDWSVGLDQNSIFLPKLMSLVQLPNFKSSTKDISGSNEEISTLNHSDGSNLTDEINENFEILNDDKPEIRIDFRNVSSNTKRNKMQYIAPQGPKLSNFEKMEIRRLYYFQNYLYNCVRIKYNKTGFNETGFIDPRPFLRVKMRDLIYLTQDSIDIFPTASLLNDSSTERDIKMGNSFEKIPDESGADFSDFKTKISSNKDLIGEFSESEKSNSKLYFSDMSLNTSLFHSSLQCNSESNIFLIIKVKNNLGYGYIQPSLSLRLVCPEIYSDNLNGGFSELSMYMDQNQSSALFNRISNVYSEAASNEDSLVDANGMDIDTASVTRGSELYHFLRYTNSPYLNDAKSKAAARVIKTAVSDVPLFQKQTANLSQRNSLNSTSSIKRAARHKGNSPVLNSTVRIKNTAALHESSLPTNETSQIEKNIVCFSKKKSFIFKSFTNTSPKLSEDSQRNFSSNPPANRTKHTGLSLHKRSSYLHNSRSSALPMSSLTRSNSLSNPIERRSSSQYTNVSLTNVADSAKEQIITDSKVAFTPASFKNRLYVPVVLFNPVTDYKLPVLDSSCGYKTFKIPVFISSKGKYVFEYEINILPNQPDESVSVIKESSIYSIKAIPNDKTKLNSDLNIVSSSKSIEEYIDPNFTSPIHKSFKGSITIYSV
ncbi:Transport protein particle subunit [Smittium culicis]|uniref:Transport protein particle subunit n=1 Tax=Smittium culicis TaxID=133412 RepID=A0A1R1YH11_9FUNG|nr:Transport protein particle subunit [Smittium culicis]